MDKEDICANGTYDQIVKLFSEDKNDLCPEYVYEGLDRNENLNHGQKIRLFNLYNKGEDLKEQGWSIKRMIFLKEYISQMLDKDIPISWHTLAEHRFYADDSESLREILSYVGKRLEKVTRKLKQIKK